MPTIRQSASSKKLLAHIVLATGFIGTIVLTETFVHEKNEMRPAYFIPFAIGGLAMLLAQFLIKCQACGGNLGPVIMTTGSPIAVSKKIKYCPYCGISIDTDVSQCRKAS